MLFLSIRKISIKDRDGFKFIYVHTFDILLALTQR
jgi:hypothetical protein